MGAGWLRALGQLRVVGSGGLLGKVNGCGCCFFRVKGREERKEGSKDATGERLDYCKLSSDVELREGMRPQRCASVY